MNLDYLNIKNSCYNRNSSADQLVEDSINLKEGVIGPKRRINGRYR